MKNIETTMDKFDMVAVSSMTGIVLGLACSIVSFLLGFALRFSASNGQVGPSLSDIILNVAIYSGKILLTFGLLGAIFYQVESFKNKDDLPGWWVLFWFEGLAAVCIFVLFFPSLYMSVLAFIFRG